MKKIMRWILPLVVCGLCVSTLLSQISVDVALVTLVATVTDSSGRSVPDLRPEDFIVTEDGKEQNVTLVEQNQDLPVSMGVVLDTSGSMEPKIQTAASAIDNFLDSLLRDDDIFLMTFAEQPQMLQPFTTDRNKISSALRRIRLGNNTALYAAVQQGVREVRKGKHEKKAILLVTDGQDTANRVTLDQAMLDVRQSHVLVYALGIAPSGLRLPGSTTTGGPQTIPRTIPGTGGRGGGGGINTPGITLPGGIKIPLPGGPIYKQFPSGTARKGGTTVSAGNGQDTVDMNILDQIAQATGGKAWLITDRSVNGSTMDDALDEISAELRNQYTIGYHPSHSMNDGKWHQVTVKAKNSRYDVRSRKEYFGGDNPGK